MDANLIDKMSTYSVISTKENGWQRNGDELIIGNGRLYENSMETEASLFVALPETMSVLSYSVAVDSEYKFDFFKVYVVIEGKKPILVQSLSGHVPETAFNLNLASIAGQKIEIRFVFKADEGTKDKGVTLKNVVLK
jgi:hypothetical protein